MELNIRETLRYLGYNGQKVDDNLMNLIYETGEEVKKQITPKSVYRIYDCEVDDNTVKINTLEIKSKNLAYNLRGCDKVTIMAATLGINVDMLIKKYTISNVTKAAIVQAASAAMVETLCDKIQEELRESLEKEGLYLKPRFSPGYGDLALEHQRDIFAMLECNKRVGITLTDKCLMIPSKSVTAFIGITKNKDTSCEQDKCTTCLNTECEYKRG